MRVLGISPLDKDATVSFVENGRVQFACGEERLSRQKLQAGFPLRALKLGLEQTGWSLESIDHVAYAFFTGAEEARLIREAADADRVFQNSRNGRPAKAYNQQVKRPYALNRETPIPGLADESHEFMERKPWWKRIPYELAAGNARADQFSHDRFFSEWIDRAVRDHQRWSDELEDQLNRLGLRDKLVRFHHHDTHAANAFYGSGLEEALVLVLDGYGSGCCGGIYVADAHQIRPLHRYRFPYSLGIFYEQVTSALGFRPSRHEGKIVGLAAYGDQAVLLPVLHSRFELQDGDIRIQAAQNHYFARALSQHYAKRDIAAAYQTVLERVACDSLAYWLQQTGASRVVMSGGVHANVKLNQRIREVPGVEEVFVYPNMGDGGCATGAALLATGHAASRHSRIEHVYYGPAYAESEIAAALDMAELEREHCECVERRMAEVLADNAIVARFHGRMEYGPRALGNRSILYSTQDPSVNQWLNDQLGRTEFMPFAPAVMADKASQLFHGLAGSEATAEFMTITFDCTDAMIENSPAAVHVDGTARPQLVTPESNASFYEVLSHYHDLTGVPVLINTSFNMHEEPIVCTPQDAVAAFLAGNIDYLAIGPFLVPHPNSQHRRQRASARKQVPS